MKTETLFLFTTLLVSLLSLPVVIADDVLKVEFNPDSWSAGTSEEVTLTLTNKPTSADSVIGFELVLPLDDDGALVYDVKNEVIIPPGWDYKLSIAQGKPNIISLTAVGAGLVPGSSVDFVFNSITAPQEPSQTLWSWAAQTSGNETDVGQITTAATFGNLKTFELKNLPEEVGTRETFVVTLAAVEESDFTKEDFVGTVVITSTDPRAVITSAGRTFSADDKGEKMLTITFNTAGNQKITVRDQESGIVFQSDSINVLPGVPRELKVSINNGASSTNSESVVLTLSVKIADECRYSNDGIIWSDYEEFTTTKNWKLIEGDGTKSVYYQCRNVEGVSSIMSDSIVFSSTAVSIPRTGFVVNTPTIISIVALFISIVTLTSVMMGGRDRKNREET